MRVHIRDASRAGQRRRPWRGRERSPGPGDRGLGLRQMGPGDEERGGPINGGHSQVKAGRWGLLLYGFIYFTRQMQERLLCGLLQVELPCGGIPITNLRFIPLCALFSAAL